LLRQLPAPTPRCGLILATPRLSTGLGVGRQSGCRPGWLPRRDGPR
jgi:hypothetical protein